LEDDVEEALFYAQFLLDERGRARMNRAWLDTGSMPDDAISLLRSRYTAQELRAHHLAIVDACARLGIRRVDLLEGSLPAERVDPVTDPPGVLFLRGDPSILHRSPSVGVVGARRGTERGRRIAHRFGTVLGRAGVTVVSGMALGVDGASHRGCLEVGGPALAWLASGVETVAPARHRDLYARLRDRGLLASEYPPGTPVRKHHFVARNRLIAAFSDALLVVEAGERSGTRSTVDFTLELGRELFCLPGPVDCPHSAGTLRWIREGARMVRSPEDLLEDLSIGLPPAEETAPLGLTACPESTAAIARRNSIPMAQATASLVQAQARGEVCRLPGDRWCAAGLAADPARP
jgi:DNA processing protein